MFRGGARNMLSYWFINKALKVLKTICSSVQPYTPEDGHSGARNMLSY